MKSLIEKMSDIQKAFDEMSEEKEAPVHFFNFDKRFCGSTEQYRRVVLDLSEVTCPECLGQTGLKLTEQGQAYLDTLKQK